MFSCREAAVVEVAVLSLSVVSSIGSDVFFWQSIVELAALFLF